MSKGSLGDRLVTFLQAAVGCFHGVIAHLNVLDSMVFAGVSGSSVADTASMGAISLNSMKKAGFPADFSAAVTGCTAIIGPIIPPSGGLVMMAVYFGCSARQMFLGGILPGVLMGIFEMITVYILSVHRHYPCEKWGGWKKLLVAAKHGFCAFLLPAIVIVSLLLGIGTVVEIGAFSCMIAVIMEILYKELSFKKFIKMLMRTTIMSSALLSLISISGVFTWLLSSMGVAGWVAGQVTALGFSATSVVTMCMILLLILGCFLPVPVILYVIIPVMVPVLQNLHVDPIWFGVIATLVIQIGLLTPPVGTLIYLTAQMAECNAMDVVKQNIPLLIGLLILVGLMILFPPLVTSVPYALA